MHPNLTAYEGFELLERFDSESFGSYCQGKLNSCDKHTTFLREHCISSDWAGRVCEVGSGSGKLLYRLERERLLTCGVGYELSASRCRFSKKFGEFCSSKCVEIRNADFVSAKLPQNSFDLIIGIDVVLNLIGAISPNHTQLFLQQATRALKPGGTLVVELMTCEREFKFIGQSEESCCRTWKHFPVADPFLFGLDEITLEASTKNLVWRKTFVGKEGSGLEYSVQILKPFSREEFTPDGVLEGFRVNSFSSWTDGDDTSDQKFILVMTKQANSGKS